MNEPVVWTACLDCGKRVTGDSIHTCSPQLKTLTDEEINKIAQEHGVIVDAGVYEFARAILRKAQEK
jgi:tRNA G37 N-methylase TrmD